MGSNLKKDHVSEVPEYFMEDRLLLIFQTINLFSFYKENLHFKIFIYLLTHLFSVYSKEHDYNNLFHQYIWC